MRASALLLRQKRLIHKAPIVVRANDPAKTVDIERVDRNRIVCIKGVDVPMMVREIHNPGITKVLEKLLSSEGQDLRSIQVPRGSPSFSFGRLAHNFHESHGAILIGMRTAGNGLDSASILNPAFHATVEGGMFLDYISRKPLKIDWAGLQKLLDDHKY